MLLENSNEQLEITQADSKLIKIFYQLLNFNFALFSFSHFRFTYCVPGKIIKYIHVLEKVNVKVSKNDIYANLFFLKTWLIIITDCNSLPRAQTKKANRFDVGIWWESFYQNPRYW